MVVEFIGLILPVMRLYLPRNLTLVSNLLVNDKITALYHTNISPKTP